MITVTINGKQQRLAGPLTIAAYVETLPVNQRHVAVAINGEVVPRDRWPDTSIADGDSVEIVRMVGGGSGLPAGRQAAPRAKEPLAMEALFLFLAFGAGAAGAVQSLLNGSLSQERGVPETVLLSVTVTYLTILVILSLRLALGETLNLELPGRRSLPYLLPLLVVAGLALAGLARGISWYYFGAGLGGVAILFAVAVAAPRVGVAPTLAALVAGMMITGLVLDQFGLLGLTALPIDAAKVIGVLFIIGGVILVRGF